MELSNSPVTVVDYSGWLCPFERHDTGGNWLLACGRPVQHPVPSFTGPLLCNRLHLITSFRAGSMFSEVHTVPCREQLVRDPIVFPCQARALLSLIAKI